MYSVQAHMYRHTGKHVQCTGPHVHAYRETCTVYRPTCIDIQGNMYSVQEHMYRHTGKHVQCTGTHDMYMYMYLVTASKDLHKGGSLLNRLVPQHHPDAHHGDGAAEAIGDLDAEPSALGTHHVETVGAQSHSQLLFVVHMQQIIAAKLKWE